MIDLDGDEERAADLARDAAEFIAAEAARLRARRRARPVPRPPNASPSDDTTIDVEIDVRIASPLNGAHSGFAAVSARRRRERTAFDDAFAGVDAPTWPSYHVALERIASAKLDGDNLQAGFKSIRDACAAWLGLDDADARITWSYAQRVERVRDDTPRTKHPWRCWCRVVVAPNAEALAAELAGANVVAPDLEPRKVAPQSKSSKPAVPELAGGDELRAIELPRRGGRSSRLVAVLRVMSKPSGRGTSLPTGSRYIRLAVHWEQRSGAPWRSQGVAIHADEIDALIAALQALRLTA